jgi:hypothetical protein
MSPQRPSIRTPPAHQSDGPEILEDVLSREQGEATGSSQKHHGAVRAKLKEAILYMERKPEIVKSITSFPTFSSHSDVEMVLEPRLRAHRRNPRQEEHCAPAPALPRRPAIDGCRGFRPTDFPSG